MALQEYLHCLDTDTGINLALQHCRNILYCLNFTKLVFLVASWYMKTDLKRNENFGFSLTIYMNWEISYWLWLGSKTELIVQMSTLDIWYMKANLKWTDNFSFGLTMCTNWKASYWLWLGSKTNLIIQTEMLCQTLPQLHLTLPQFFYLPSILPLLHH